MIVNLRCRDLPVPAHQLPIPARPHAAMPQTDIVVEPPLDLVWNRACGFGLPPAHGIGDDRLSAVIGFHSAVMADGPHQAAGDLDQDALDQVADAYAYLNVPELAEWIRRLPTRSEATDAELRSEYLRWGKDDSLFEAFAARFRVSPGDFWPPQQP